MEKEVVPSDNMVPIPKDLVQAIATVLGAVPSSVGAEVFLALRNYLASINLVQ